MTPHGPRDVTTLRRALIAGGVVWAVIATLLVLLALQAGLGWAALPANVVLAGAFGGIVTTGWLWLAALLDVIAGQPPSRRRWLWSLALMLATVVGIPLALALSVAGQR